MRSFVINYGTVKFVSLTKNWLREVAPSASIGIKLAKLGFNGFSSHGFDEDPERLMKICSALISSGFSFGKGFVKNSNSLLSLWFFEVSVEWCVITLDDYPIFTGEFLEKYWNPQKRIIILSLYKIRVQLQEQNLQESLQIRRISFLLESVAVA